MYIIVLIISLVATFATGRLYSARGLTGDLVAYYVFLGCAIFSTFRLTTGYMESLYTRRVHEFYKHKSEEMAVSERLFTSRIEKLDLDLDSDSGTHLIKCMLKLKMEFDRDLESRYKPTLINILFRRYRNKSTELGCR